MKADKNASPEDSDFLIEKIKQRPLNRRKLLRRTLITALMAVLFGVIACLTFFLLEPVINNWLYPKEETKLADFPEEIIIDEGEEIGPEEMIADDAQMQAENAEENSVTIDEAYIREMVNNAFIAQTADADDYISMNNEVLAIAREAEKAMVTVTGVTSDVDIFNNEFESRGQTPGVIIEDNGTEYLILTRLDMIESAETIRITFIDGKQYPAEISITNEATDLAIITVAQAEMSDETKQALKVIGLGSSVVMSVVGTPIIALGDVFGSGGAICQGFVTSATGGLGLEDSSYRIITTSISGSSSAAGIIINMQGNVIGIIDNRYNNSDIKNIVSALGISELKQLIRSMSTNMEKAYAGIYGMDVPAEANEVLGVPLGTYVTEVVMDSPAMAAGIQSGDVIVRAEDKEILIFNDFISTLFNYPPEEDINLTVMRDGPEGYREMELTLSLGHSSGK